MSAGTLLVELLTEELPPKALARLGRAFADALHADLARDGLINVGARSEWFATPRRLAVAVNGVSHVAPDKPLEVQGPSVKAGLDAEGGPTKALEGFARKNNVTPDSLEQMDTPKGRVFVYRGLARGAALDDVLASKVEAALKALPIPKVMRWGAGDAEFVRPVHGLIMLHGSRVVPGIVLGLNSGNTTLGHRFLSKGGVTIPDAGSYAKVLQDEGHVVASFVERRAAIELQLAAEAGHDTFIRDESLLDEVTALVESPAVYPGTYSADFLDVPPECLVLSMKQHQKYFPLTESSGKLVARFLVVSNLPISDPANIVHGNERVLRARLSDAKFFYDQDRKVRLETRVPELASVVYHNKLGSQLQRVERLERLAQTYAEALNMDPAPCTRAARLAKADLLTGMVGEFPELQGIMGRYYALHDGESAEVADAVEAHYRPRFAGDAVPGSQVAAVVALADKMEALAGFFGLGQQPTGDKDPYGLRRQALGVIRILAERALPLELPAMIAAAYGVFDASLELKPAREELRSFFFDRMRAYFAESGYSPAEIDAVLSKEPSRVDLIPRQLEAVKVFNTLPEAPSLAAANKRIANILRKSEGSRAKLDPSLFVEDAEKALASAFTQTRATAEQRYASQDYTGMLQALAALKGPVDAFFDGVMVMAEDDKLRANRVALLAQLRETMNRVADISKLAVERS